MCARVNGATYLEGVLNLSSIQLSTHKLYVDGGLDSFSSSSGVTSIEAARQMRGHIFFK